MNRRWKRIVFACFMLLSTALLGLAVWVWNPLDQNAWRVTLKAPIVGRITLRAWPLIQLGTSKLGRFILNNTAWHTSFGLVHVESQPEGLRLRCQPCVLHWPELSHQAVTLDFVRLSVRPATLGLSGTLEIQHDQLKLPLQYTAQANAQGIAIQWTLPKTEIAQLLSPLNPQSSAIQRAHITGTLSATGTLHWPSKRWKAQPTIEHFDVTGLGTEQLRHASAPFQCPSSSGPQTTPSRPHSPHRWLSPKKMGRWLPKAVLIAEDARFMQHHGYDWAIVSYLLGQETNRHVLGGSTITQQLAKYLFTGGERLWKRKIEELLYAVEMENTLGKTRILNLYLNTVDWGPSICGAAAASEYYFARTPQTLTPVQAAWLAGILRNPHRAWRTEYKTGQPNLTRLENIRRSMPKRSQNYPTELSFFYPEQSPHAL